ncbi:MAG: hypothetical protein ABI910_10155 [Gemmatimonadota bacterium]
MANNVVARYSDGRLLKGSTLDVDPKREKFHVRSDDESMTQVLLAELKALFFVKSLDGDAAHVEGQEIAPVDPRLRGSRVIEVTFHDGEKIVGLCTRYPPKGAYFFIVPVDSDSNNLRILINSAALQGMTPVDGANG